MSFRQLQDALHEAMVADARDDEIGDALAEEREFTCPLCRGMRTIQPDRCTAPEECPRCVDPDEGA